MPEPATAQLIHEALQRLHEFGNTLDGLSEALAASLTAASDVDRPRNVKVQMPAEVIATVDLEAGCVVEVHILPAQSPTDVTPWDLDGVKHTGTDIADAINIANTTNWPPLFDLPERVIWEG